MTSYRIKVAEHDLAELRRLVTSDLPREAAAFALAGVSIRGDDVTILIRRAIAIPAEQYVIQNEYHLRISSQAINGLAAVCEKNGLGAVLCHSHPTDSPYSSSDDYGEGRVFDALRYFIPPNAPTASLLICPGGIRARVWVPGAAHPEPVTELLVLGRRIERIRLQGAGAEDPVPDIYDRQVRAFGIAGQRLIAQTKVAVVGVGGTGSPSAEQLVRLGVRDMVLIDPDIFEASNVTRVYGTFAVTRRAAQPRYKVRVVARHLRRINPAARIRAVPKHIAVQNAAVQLLDRDVILLCTDDHWGRSLVNRVAYQYFIPAINTGVHIGARDGSITAAVGVVDALRPDMPCLWCTGFLRSERIAAESMPLRERRSRQGEGYVEDIATPTPSVVSLTTTVSGLAVSLFLQLVTDFMGSNGDVARLNLNPLDGTVRRGRAQILERCVCRLVRGFGDLKSLPTQDDLNHLRR